MSSQLRRAIDAVTRLHGVRGALVVHADDGMIVADALMEGVRGNAIAALAASLTRRFGDSARATGVGAPHFLQLQADDGTLLVVPGPTGILVVVIGDRGMNVGLARLEMLRVAEVVL